MRYRPAGETNWDKWVRFGYTGAITNFLAKNPTFLEEKKDSISREALLKLYGGTSGTGVTDSKRLILLGKKQVFSFEEIRPIVMKCADPEAVLMLWEAFFPRLSEDEVLLVINVERIARYLTRRVVHGTVLYGAKAKNINRLANTIPGLRDLLSVFEVMDV